MWKSCIVVWTWALLLGWHGGVSAQSPQHVGRGDYLDLAMDADAVGDNHCRSEEMRVSSGEADCSGGFTCSDGIE